MRCPECVTEGERSEVYPGWTTTTAMPVHVYYDEDGELQRDDSNTRTTSYTCNRGHEWQETTGGWSA